MAIVAVPVDPVQFGQTVVSRASNQAPAPSSRVLNVDLDGVCSDYFSGFRDFTARAYGMNPADLPQPSDYNLAKVAGWPFASTADYLETHRRAVSEGLYASLPPIPGAAEALRALDAEGVYLRVVTHRLLVGGLHLRAVTDTAQWLDDNGIPYMSLCFAGLKDDISADLHIDDSPDTVSQLRAAGQQVLVYDQPYNQGLAGPRMRGWNDAVRQILRLLDER